MTAQRRLVVARRALRARERPAAPGAVGTAGPTQVELAARGAGNAALSRDVALSRDPAPPAPDPARAADEAALAAFMAKTYSDDNVKPSTGGGLFAVTYDPSAGEMVVTVRISFNFVTGNMLSGEWLTGIGGGAGLMAGFGPKGWKAEDFIWTEDEKAAWSKNAVDTIQGIWSERYTFFTRHANWEGLPPVRVRVRVADAPVEGDDGKKAQWVVTVNKWPDEGKQEESMNWGHGTDNQAQGKLHEQTRDAGGIESPDVRHFSRDTTTRRRYGQVATDNPGTISFAQGKSDLSATDVAALQKLGATLAAPDMPPFPVTVTGRASSEGTAGRNQTLSEDRARVVSNEIVKGGPPQKQPTVESKGADGADATPAWRRVDITIGTFESDQHTVAHEFGHMLGLDDEYPEPDAPIGTAQPARAVGGAPDHSKLVGLIPGQQPIQAHHSDDIMSNGEVVRPHHYLTFLEAIGKLTGTLGQWDIKPDTGAGTHGPGDFPTPAPARDGTATA